MTTFTAWKFDDAGRAEQALGVLHAAATDGLVRIIDHAVVSWPEGEDHPEVEHGRDDTWRGAGWGAFWGVVVGALFLVPVAGGAAGAAIGAVSRATRGTGITEEQLERIRTQVTEGTSALFLVTDEGDLDRLGERFRGMGNTLIATNLTEAERTVLLETFDGR